jgi:hypothetical protein
MDELSESQRSTRRGLLWAFARSAARHTREGAEVLGPGGLQALVAGEESPIDGSAGTVAPTVLATPARSAARAVARAASLDELIELAHEEGLIRRDDELRALARRSLRMTSAEQSHGDAWILPGDDWGAAGGEVLLGLINLAAATAHDYGLSGTGWLVLFVASGNGSADFEARRARGVLVDIPPAVSDAAERVVLSPELVIPRRWHEIVQALEFGDCEAEAYDRLRTRLQAFQGIESDDDGGAQIAYHRLLGYPHATTGNMPQDCVRALRDW